ncbi:MAG: histidine kinase [Homoserinimonas sp.]|nr:histidine kinase [Homoserinimonas sp.]
MCDHGRVEPLAKERDRLLQRSARTIGLGFSALSLIIFLIPGVVEPALHIGLLPLFACLTASFILLAKSRSLIVVGAGIISGLGILLVAQIPFDGNTSRVLLNAMAPVASGGLASFAMVLLTSKLRVTILAVTFLACLTVMATAAPGDGVPRVWLIVILGWSLITVFGYWLTASVPRAARRIYSIGRAHRTERRASETEAQRRQSARLLHDTVLATLTLLAHSGVGVAPEAMREQAADDARLLRQLRLGVAPVPTSSGQYNLEPVQETALGTTLESVKQRFGRMGLEVSWHGTGQVLLPSDVLDAFLLALAECLENVRRHAGVTDAHVTITDDDTTVRAMVTDSGVGFDIKNVDEARLGLKDSVIGRLSEVGGSARLFSAAGAGTTVVLEVPRV